MPRYRAFLTTPCAQVGEARSSGPAAGLQAIQNRAAASAQQVQGLDPTSRTARTTAHAGSLTVSTASAIPPANHPRWAGSQVCIELPGDWTYQLTATQAQPRT